MTPTERPSCNKPSFARCPFPVACSGKCEDGYPYPPAPSVPVDGERPGGWVEGIGWVALLPDLDRDAAGWAGSATYRNGEGVPLVIVTRWADGTTPAPVPPTPQERPDELIGMLRDAAADAYRDLNLTIARSLLRQAANALAALPVRDQGGVPPDDPSWTPSQADT